MRFDLNADTYSDAVIYLNNRRLQLAHSNVSLIRYEKCDVGVWGVFSAPDDFGEIDIYYSLYLLKKHRGNGAYYNEYLRKCKEVGQTLIIMTSTDCKLLDYFQHKKIYHVVIDGLTQSNEYKAIEELYGDKKAKRSDVYLMNHIDEGLYILNEIGASFYTKLAYIIHPILQSDDDLLNSFKKSNYFEFISGKSLILAMEYRNIANDYLSNKQIDKLEDIKFSCLVEVQDMLIADKIQNCKDFEKYHKGIHKRSDELTKYFDNWLKRLNISDKFYNTFKDDLTDINTISITL